MVGCTSEHKSICTIDIQNNEEGYSLTGNYTIYYKENYVTKIVKDELYESSNEEMIDYFSRTKDLEYYNFKDLYGGLEYSITTKSETVKVNAIFDMKKVDMLKIISDEYINTDYIVSNKLTISGVKYLYTEKGAVCK